MRPGWQRWVKGACYVEVLHHQSQITQPVHQSRLLLMPYLSQVLLTEETEKERAARVAALEDGEMLMESPLPGSSTPAYTHSMQPGQQGRPSWPLASPALSPGAYTCAARLMDSLVVLGRVIA